MNPSRITSGSEGAHLGDAGDPLADAAVAAIMARGGLSDRGADLLAIVEGFAEHGESACVAFVSETRTLPDWVDPAAVARGQRLTLSVVVPTAAVLLLGGLTEVYAVPSIAAVLGASGRLHDRTWLRMLETGRFLLDVHARDGLRAQGDGLRSVLRVRLLHAMIRRAQCKRTGTATITQSELAFTLCAHSHVVRRGLEVLGLPLTEAEAHAHHHLWRLVGHAMGISPRLLPDSPQAEAALYRRLRRRFVSGDSPTSQALVERSIAAVAERSSLPTSIVAAVVARLVGRPLATSLGVRPSASASSVVSAACRVFRCLGALRRAVPASAVVLAPLGRMFGNLVVARDPGRADPVGVAAARGCISERPTSAHGQG